MTDLDRLKFEIYKYIENKRGKHFPIYKADDIIKIHNCFFHKIYSDTDHSIVNFYYGFYYEREKDYVNMLKYYLLSIQQGSKYAEENLRTYLDNCYSDSYHEITDYSQKFQLFISAMVNGNHTILNDLGDGYEDETMKWILEKYINKASVEDLVLVYHDNKLWFESEGIIDIIIKEITTYLKKEMITDSLLNIIKEIDISNQSSISETNSLFLLIKNLLIINQEKNELVSLI